MRRLLPYGAGAVLVEVDDLDEVLGLHAALHADPPPGLVDLVPAARTVLVRFDPGVVERAVVERAVREVPLQPVRAGDDRDVVEVPVRYDGEDLDEVAELTGWGRAGVVERHTGTTWTVAFGGFAPGFGYLVADEGEWDVPRRSSPRSRVPAGSVGLAGEFSGVYPRSSPGGWQLIGRTDLTLFDVDRDRPALLRPGVRVRFQAVEAGA